VTASLIAINGRGCNLNSLERRNSILQVWNVHLTDISNASKLLFIQSKFRKDIGGSEFLIITLARPLYIRLT
jgi:hypothetical protein